MAENRPYLDFKAIKERVTMADILPRYQANLKRVNQTTLRGNCPLPSHKSGSKNTFFVNEAKSVWYCHSDSCKKNGASAGGNVLDFVARIENCSVYAAAKRIDEMFPMGHIGAGKQSVSEADTGSAPCPSSPERPGTPSPGGNKPLAFVLKDICAKHPMIQAKGISEATAAAYGVGFFPGKGSMAGRIVFPLYELLRRNPNGSNQVMLVGYAGRTTLDVTPENPKWKIGNGVRKTFLYGLDRCDPAKPLILCESFWGPLWFHERGVQAASLMGTEMTEEQEQCLDPFAVITVALDNDAAGLEKVGPICNRLRNRHRILKARLME